MQIIENKALLLKVRDPKRITNVIPKSHMVDDHQVLVRWGLEEAQVLKNLGVKNIPSPISKNYEWPGLYKPFHHQKITAEFLTLNRRAFCFNEQGTGKTASVIWAADYLMTMGFIRRVLVLCPLSIMGSAWQQDLFRFAMHRSVTLAHHRNAKRRKELIREDTDFVIMNYDGVEIVKEEIMADGRFDLVVVDECFVAGVLVATPQGRRPIEQLKAGDKVLTSDGVMRINKLVRNTTTQLVEVNLGNGKTIRCTPEHPFFTDSGWVCAKNLTGRRLVSGVELSCLRAGISPRAFPGAVGYGEQPTPWIDLLKILRTEEVALSESQQERLLQLATRATGETVGTENSGAPHKAVGGSESQRAQTPGTGRERHWDDENGATDFRGFACGVGMELPGSVGPEAARLSYELQARLRMATTQDRARSGRGQSYGSSAASAGSQKGSEAGGAWVVSVSYIECPDGEAVYNLEVEGTPNYFVGDHWLVHNCNAYKTVSTTRWKTFNKLVKPDTWLWMLTGTPASQSPEDAYGLARLVNPSGVPKFFGSFRDMVMNKITQFKWAPKPSAVDTVYKVLQPAIRFTKDQCLDLPDMVYVMRDVPLSKQQQKYYDIMRTQMLVEAAGEEISAVNAAAKLTKLLQISAGAVYSDADEVVDFDCKDRMNVLKEVIDESSHKVLVFAPFRHSIYAIAAELKKSGYTLDVIDGSVAPGKRTEIFSKFQTESDPRILVIQPQAASHGVTLHAADTVVYWSPVMSVETYLQANARVHRAGQKNNVTIVHLQGSPVERRMYKMLSGKVDVHEKLVDLYREEMKDDHIES